MKKLTFYKLNGRHKPIVFLLVFCMVMAIVLIPNQAFTTFALGASGSQGGGGSLGESGALGQSGEVISITTAQELLEVSKRVNGGESFTGKTVLIKNEIALTDLTEWVPLGMSGNPFTGTLNGENQTIRGIDTENPKFATLFGDIKDATVKNLTLAVRSPDNLQDVSAYLYTSMQTSTITNCKVVLDTYVPFMIFGRSRAYNEDVSWYKGPNSYDLTTREQLAGLAKVVKEDGATGYTTPACDGFDGFTITFKGNNVDLGGINWVPIGTQSRPFKGTFEGGGNVLTGMTIDNLTEGAVGLFGYTDGATINQINVRESSVVGNNDVGILVGHMKDSKVTNCSTSGDASGTTNVGGAIGSTEQTGGTTKLNAQWCYSTANVNGTNNLGGLIGYVGEDCEVTHCFATGNVRGVVNVGGFAGQVFNDYAVGKYTLSYVSSTGRVKAYGKVGGLVGGGTIDDKELVINSYTASVVEAFEDGGGILGGMGQTQYTYTSGRITGPEDATFIGPGTGMKGKSIYSMANPPSYSAPNQESMSPANYLISSDNVIAPSPGNAWFPTPGFPITPPGLGGQFTNTDLTYTSPNTMPDSGSYFQLKDFNSGPSAFSAYSKVSTNVAVVNIPDEMEYNAGYLVDVGGRDFSLDSIGDLVSWNFQNESKILKVADSMVEGGFNTLEIKNGEIAIAHKPTNEFTFTLEARVAQTGLEDIVVKKTIAVKDMMVGVVDKSFPKYLKDTGAAAEKVDNSIRLTPMENMFFIEFNEPVTGADITNTAIQKCNSAWGVVGAPINADFKMITDTLMQISWTGAPFTYSDRLKITVPTNHFEDNVGNKFEPVYYFKMVDNKLPELRFNPHTPNVTETSANEDTQTIRMVRSDPSYNSVQGYLEGIQIDNETVIPITDLDVRMTAKTLAPPSVPVGLANFHQYPGIYTLTYRVKDPESLPATVWSKEIVRTYNVTDEIKDLFLAGGVFGETHLPKHQPQITLDATTVGAILRGSNAGNANANIISEVEKRLRAMHKATLFDGSGKEISLSIAYDFAKLKLSNLYADGYNDVALYGIDGAAMSTPVYINIEPATNLIEISTRHDQYLLTYDEKFDKDEARRYYEPRLERDGVAQRNIPVKWELIGAVDTTKLYKPQVVTIYANNIYGIAGFSKKKEVTVLVVPEKDEPFYFRDDPSTRYDPAFWERVEVAIRKAEPGNKVEVFLERKYADAPKVIFTALAQKEDVTLVLKHVDNGLTLSIHSDDVDVGSIESPADLFNVYIENNIEDLYVNRDARGEPVQQFFVKGYYDIPAAYTLDIPLEEDMADKKTMELYTFDMDTGEYIYITRIDKDAVKNGVLTVELRSIDGEYVIH